LKSTLGTASYGSREASDERKAGETSGFRYSEINFRIVEYSRTTTGEREKERERKRERERTSTQESEMAAAWLVHRVVYHFCSLGATFPGSHQISL